MQSALQGIREELNAQVPRLRAEGKLSAATRRRRCTVTLQAARRVRLLDDVRQFVRLCALAPFEVGGRDADQDDIVIGVGQAAGPAWLVQNRVAHIGGVRVDVEIDRAVGADAGGLA